MSYEENKRRAVTVDNTPSLTDQSAADDTDLNVIVRQYLTQGTARGNPENATYGDFTQLPTDLRGFIELGRTLQDTIEELPLALRATPLDELVQMTNEQIARILTPAEPVKPTEPKETQPT